MADEFKLRIIRTYGAAGHGKGVIDAMSSFCEKNVLRHDIVTLNVFFLTKAKLLSTILPGRNHSSLTKMFKLMKLQQNGSMTRNKIHWKLKIA